MDATTPRGDDGPDPAQPADPPPLTEPAQQPRAAESTAVGAAPAPSSQASGPEAPASQAPSDQPAADRGPEDPTVPDVAVEATLTTEPAGESPNEPVVPTPHPDEVQVAAPPTPVAPAAPAAAPEAPAQPGMPAESSQPLPPADVVYVAAPTPPKKQGNRGVGMLLAALSTVLFFAVYVGVVVLINVLQGRPASLVFLEDLRFYIPVLLFAIGFILLAVIVNRAGWWSFVLGSFFVGAFVYLGSVGLLLLSAASTLTPADAVQASRSLLISPILVAAGLVAREVALWVGAAISARGRRVKARNAAARAEFDRRQAEHRAEMEESGAVVRPA